MSIQIVHMDQRIPANLIDICLTLATHEASNLSALHYPQDSPLIRLAEVEVELLLTQELESIGSKATINDENLVSGLVIAIEDDKNNETVKILGFIHYKRHVGPDEVASVGYLCVHPSHRGKGLASQMMKELKNRFVGICLTSRLDHITLYEKIDFEVVNNPPLGTKVFMKFGKISGQNWTRIEDVESSHAYQSTKSQLKQMLGKSFDVEFNKLIDNSEKERIRAINFVRLVFSDNR